MALFLIGDWRTFIYLCTSDSNIRNSSTSSGLVEGRSDRGGENMGRWVLWVWEKNGKCPRRVGELSDNIKGLTLSKRDKEKEEMWEWGHHRLSGDSCRVLELLVGAGCFLTGNLQISLLPGQQETTCKHGLGTDPETCGCCNHAGAQCLFLAAASLPDVFLYPIRIPKYSHLL